MQEGPAASSASLGHVGPQVASGRERVRCSSASAKLRHASAYRRAWSATGYTRLSGTASTKRGHSSERAPLSNHEANSAAPVADLQAESRDQDVSAGSGSGAGGGSRGAG